MPKPPKNASIDGYKIITQYQVNMMPKKAYLSAHFSSDELKQHYLHCTEPVESRRWHLLWLISIGWTIKKASQAVGINYDYA